MKELFYQGQFWAAVWVADEAGRFRGREYFDELLPADRARLEALIQRACDVAIGIRDTTKFRNEGDGIWVFKRFQDRLFCFQDEKTWCITHGIRKKKDKMLAKDLEIARRIREHYRNEERR